MIKFVGAGSGAPDLITVRGMKLLQEADVIIYAGSLVNPQLLEYKKEDCQVYNSAYMTLEEVLEVIQEAHRCHQMTARVHTGDPSIFGAHREQMDRLDALGIPYEVIPGVSSFLSAAAELKREYTLPGVSQTVILTRMEGRTGVPERESIERLAEHRATMVVFLSVGKVRELCRKMIPAYGKDTPAAVVYKASWEDQRILRGTLETLPALVEASGIRKTALTLVGEFLGDDYELSRLYDRTFTHEYRKGSGEDLA